MIIVFRNFNRNKMVNLTARSIKHFMPDIEIHCLSLGSKEDEPLLPFIKEFKAKTQYISKNPVQDHIDSTKTSGYANPDNAKYFTEGFNLIQAKFKHHDKKVLVLAEDHFFTTGATLKELNENDWHIAYASGYNGDHHANGSILGFNPARVNHLFPLKENFAGTIEDSLGKQLISKIKKVSNLYLIKNRKWIDYCGDGIYTNSSKEMEEELRKAGII